MHKSNYLYFLNIFLLLIFVVGVVATPVLAQGVISGKVKDYNATNPSNSPGIASAIVDAYKASDTNACPTIKGMATTDVNGAYYIYPLEHGMYRIRAYAPGYKSEYPFSLIANTCSTSCSPDYNFTLKDTNGSVIGKVFQPDGITPIGGATVRAYYPGTENVLASSTTSSEGNYTLSNVEGVYDLEASGVGWLPKKLRVTVPPFPSVLTQDFVLLPGPYYDPDAVFMGWIEIGDLTVVGDYTILLKDLQRRHPVMPPERGILEVYRKGTMVIQQVVVPGDTLYIDEIIKIKINEINDHENSNYFGRYKLHITVTKRKEPELSINLTTLYRGEIDDKDRTFLRGSKEGIKTVLLGDVDINASSGSVEFDGSTYSFNVSKINNNIQYVYNFKQVNGSFVQLGELRRGDIVTLGKDSTCKNIRELTIYELGGTTVIWTPIIHSIMRPEDFEFETDNVIEKPQSDTTFWYVTEIENTGDIPAKNVKIHITAKDFTFLTGNKCYCGSDKETCLEIKSMEPGEKRLIVFKFKAPPTDYLKVSPIQIDLSYQMAYFNEKGQEVIQDYSKTDKTLITIVPKQPEFQITRNIVKEKLFVGETTDIEVRIKNTGDITATKIKLIDYIPDGFELIDGSATMNIDKMAKNETFTLIYKVKALEMGEFDFKTQLLFEDEAGKKYKTSSKIESVTVRKEFPRLEILKKLDRVTISRGDSVIVVLVVRNTGNKIARDVQVLDFVPEGFRLIDDPKTKRIEYTIPELKPEQERMFKYIITASYPGEYKIGDTKLLYYDLEGHSFEHIAAGTSVRVNGEPKISISNIQYFNEDYSFADYKYVDVVLTLTNTGDGLAKKISYINSISGDIELVDGELGGFVDTLKQGDSKTTKFTVRVLQENKDKIFTINTSSEFEDIAGKKAKSESSTNITVGGRTPNIQLLRQESEYKSDVIRIGHIIPVVTIITNTGDGDAKNVRLEDKIPSNLQLTTGINYWGGQLKPEERVTLRYTLVPSQGGEYQIGQTLSTYEDEWGVKGTKSLSPTLVTVWGPSISRTISTNDIEEGETLKIIYTVKNWGKDDIYEVKLVEALPPGFEIVSGDKEIIIGEIKGGSEVSKELQIKATKSGAFILEDSKFYWKNVFEEIKSFDIERTTISVKAKAVPQTTLPNVPQSVTKTIEDLKASPYAPYIVIALIVLILSIVGYSTFRSVRSKGPSSNRSLATKDDKRPPEINTDKKEKLKSKKRFGFFSKQKEKVVKSEQKIPIASFESQAKSLSSESKKEKNSFGLFSKKEKLPSKEKIPTPPSPSLEAENKFKDFVKREEDSKILTKDQIDQELLGKKVAPPAIKQKQKNKFSLFSKKKEGIPPERKSFSLSHLYESQEDKDIKKDILRKELESVNGMGEGVPPIKEISTNNSKPELKYSRPIRPIAKEEVIIRPPMVEFRPPEEIRKELEELKSTLQDQNKLDSLDSFEIESLRSEISKTLEDIEKRKGNIEIAEQSIEQENISKLELMDRKELEEFQSKILNEINELETKKRIDFEEEQLKEIKGRVVPKNVDLDLPPSVERAYKEFRQNKNKGAPENPFNERDNGSTKKTSSWTNNFRHNNTSPEIPASIRELLEKRPSSSSDTYTPIPDVKEVIKGKKEINSHFFSRNSPSTPDPKEIIKGKKKDSI
ncbi:MAG: Translocon-associated protein beta (TRAPB) [Candidatus Methanofastidiosum methylothiophilum]|uniref:Translocon-associated protein beta (TRAPB) n=1 Tax=Candidatus Methanofastidiosum methylothiophilum TaxID=1705564 RepID=A0A150IJF7_9EURY|nr:MAG: Translocon-associated protein beta (TRAPB) [Candidatus Methanofastidiosum methylthiophilus]KYC48676.1 MAG: Translocon-associated protein beta (TRAPB) [Candidatus Methanofastidiosum methylthiophilus]KYC51119.1 MAG: Translocon-associated protein beta (TRAPB) [Candidatus Methanofastidiosum methylthiophilus]